MKECTSERIASTPQAAGGLEARDEEGLPTGGTRNGTRPTPRAGQPIPSLDAGVGTVGLASLDRLLHEQEFLHDLRCAVDTVTRSGAMSPTTAEIGSVVVAALTAAMLIQRLPFDGDSAPRPSDQPVYRDVAAAAGAWADLAGEGRPRVIDRNSHRDVHRLSLAGRSVPPADGQICAVFVVDIVGFTRPDRDDDIRLYLHERLYEYLQRAFDDAGLPWAGCFREDRGDGALIVIPPEVPVKGLIDPLPERLRGLIRRHNHVSREAASMQLRAAAHIGPVDRDDYGFVGTDVNFAFRMLAARPLKRALAASGAELGLVVSDYVYRSLVCRYPTLVHPDAFRTMSFQAKDTKARAWMYLPGVSS